MLPNIGDDSTATPEFTRDKGTYKSDYQDRTAHARKNPTRPIRHDHTRFTMHKPLANESTYLSDFKQRKDSHLLPQVKSCNPDYQVQRSARAFDDRTAYRDQFISYRYPANFKMDSTSLSRELRQSLELRDKKRGGDKKGQQKKNGVKLDGKEARALHAYLQTDERFQARPKGAAASKRSNNNGREGGIILSKEESLALTDFIHQGLKQQSEILKSQQQILDQLEAHEPFKKVNKSQVYFPNEVDQRKGKQQRVGIVSNDLMRGGRTHRKLARRPLMFEKQSMYKNDFGTKDDFAFTKHRTIMNSSYW